MEILVTNDDGIESANLRALSEVVKKYANTFVVAPKREQSGVGHSFSYYRPLYCERVSHFPCEAHWVDGTPADCMKFALKHLYKDKVFDLVISGVNDGDNAGVASFYSGTVGAAREAAFWSVPSIAVSLQEQSDFSLEFALKWVAETLQNESFRGMPKQTLWNFNVPPCSKETPCKGFKVTTTGKNMFDDHYVESDKFTVNEGSVYRVNPSSQESAAKGFSLVGNKLPESRQGTDDWWLAKGFATLSPQQIDLTDLNEYERLNSLFG